MAKNRRNQLKHATHRKKTHTTHTHTYIHTEKYIFYIPILEKNNNEEMQQQLNSCKQLAATPRSLSKGGPLKKKGGP